jgi:GH35 family endo-1,4-beta-xylanase
MFHAHIANDYATKQALWDVVDGVVTAWSSYRSALAAVGVTPDFVPLAA